MITHITQLNAPITCTDALSCKCRPRLYRGFQLKDEHGMPLDPDSYVCFHKGTKPVRGRLSADEHLLLTPPV